MNPDTPRFITLEGSEGAGKTTAITYVKALLEDAGHHVLLTREPGGTPFAEDIRSLLLSKRKETVESQAELLLMFAARIQHVNQVIKPALASGHWVISDRFTDATFAYQGGGRQLAWSAIKELENWTLGQFKPDHTLLLDLPVETGLSRAKARSEADRFESEEIEFFERVRQGYLQREKEDPERIQRIDASCSIAEVEKQIKTTVNQWLCSAQPGVKTIQPEKIYESEK